MKNPQQQLVDKITQLEKSLKHVESLEFGIRSTFNLRYYFNSALTKRRHELESLQA